MNNRYAPDMDAEEAFGISDKAIDRILELFDADPIGIEDAAKYAKSLGLNQDQFEDVLEWFGRRKPRSSTDRI